MPSMTVSHKVATAQPLRRPPSRIQSGCHACTTTLVRAHYTGNGTLEASGSPLCPLAIQGFGRVIPRGSDVLDDCQPEDLQGTALKQNGLVEDGFGCQYPDAGQCHYSTSNGSLIVGGSMCPPTLKHTFISSSSTSLLLTNLGTSSATSAQLSPTPPTGTIAGISVGIAILLISYAIVLFWRCRRTRRAPLLPEMETISPFITQLDNPSGRSTLSTNSSALSRDRWFRSAPDLEAQLHVAREQIDMIVGRINALETHSDYSPGMVAGREAPPGYH
ncbi:hypothetical protein MVEN_01875300 [Mycena venus]|uniref:Uncharacterized protein n=1 Tax=Mycena venus TaxID=2733690 RepID=A0A8H6XH35_9AGAR|nr:hypothetical protein MVEN_01875300 [Mycena venus]